MKIIEFTLMII